MILIFNHCYCTIVTKDIGIYCVIDRVREYIENVFKEDIMKCQKE